MKSWHEIPNAPVPGTELCTIDELKASNILEREFGEAAETRFRLFIHYQLDGSIRAWHNQCPHFSVPLNVLPGEFLNRAGDQYMCRSHYAKFNVVDGFCTDGPCEGFSLRPVPVTVDMAAVSVGNPEGNS